MNKLIADFFSELISLVHILAIGGFCWYLIQEKPWQQGQSVLIFTVLAFCGYVAVTGLLSTFIVMNENIVELKKEITSLNSKAYLISLEAGSLNEAIQNLSSSAKNLGQSVTTLNELLNQDWFKKLILR